MANTYTQIFIHAVFAVQTRKMLINPAWETDLHQYISGIVRKNGHKLIAINGMPDHLHVFVGMKPNQSLSDLMQDIKADSSKWINQKKLLSVKFNWQKGFGGFSYATSQVDSLVKYINNQKQHHQKIDFIHEYLEILKKFNVDFDPKYIFSPVE